MPILAGKTIQFQNTPQMRIIFANLILPASLFFAFTCVATESITVKHKITKVKITTWKWGRIQSSALRIQEFLLRTQQTGRLRERFKTYSIEIRNHKHLDEFSSLFKKYDLYNLPYDTENLLKTKKPYMVRTVVRFSVDKKNEIILVLYTENGKTKANWLVSRKTPPLELLANLLLCFPLFEYTNNIIGPKSDFTDHVMLEKVSIYFSDSITPFCKSTQLKEMSIARFIKLDIQIPPSVFINFLTQHAIMEKTKITKGRLFVKCIFKNHNYFFPLTRSIENSFRLYEPIFLNSRYTPFDILKSK